MRRCVSIAAIAVLALSGVLSADILVTVDGQEIETEGPYEVDGRRVVYRNPDGVLTAIRATSVDLDASREATEEARRPAAPAPPPPAEKHLDVVELSRQNKSGDAAMVLESDTAGGPAGDEIARELNAVFNALPLDPTTRQRLKKRTEHTIRSIYSALERHDVTTRKGTRAAAADMRKVASELRSYARQESDPALQKYFQFVAGEVSKLAYAADRGPEALANAL